MSEDVRVRLGARLRELRAERGLSQEELAFRCGLDRTYVSGVERGVRNPSLQSLRVIAKSLDVSLSELFEGV